MAQANMTGLVSGLDSSKIIEATLAVKRAPINRLEKLIKGVQAKVSAVSEIQDSLTKLEEQMDNMEDSSEVLALKGKIGTGAEDDPGLLIIGINTDGDATEGTYQMTVSQLAGAEKMRSDSFDTKFSEVTAGTMEITVDGETDETITITIDEGDSITSVMDKINASDAKINASLIFDGSDYRLQIVNEETGFSTGTASEALVIDVTYTGGNGIELGLTEISTATNALVNIDGLDMEFSNNTLDEVLDGVSLEIKGLGTTSFEISTDKEGTKENIQAFVDAYNETLGIIRKHLTVSENSDRNSSLNGDTSLTTLKNKLQDMIGGMVEGATGTYSALSHIGITTTMFATR